LTTDETDVRIRIYSRRSLILVLRICTAIQKLAKGKMNEIVTQIGKLQRNEVHSAKGKQQIESFWSTETTVL
jgi:hypothetical protein